MKISASLEYGISAGLSYDESAQAMKAAGFQGVDLALCRNQNEPEKLCTDEWTEDVIAQADAVKRAGLEIAQCHLPYYPGHIDNPGDGSVSAYLDLMLPMYRHALKAAAVIGCRMCVTHPLYMKEGERETVLGNVQVNNAVMDLLEQYDLRLALENVFIRRNAQYVPGYVERAEVLMDMVRETGSDRVGICLDTGHANIFRFNISEMAMTFGNKLFALHVNSNAGHDEHAIPYSIAGWCERMDFEGFTRTLNDIGYSGWYNLEVTGGRFPAEIAPAYYSYAAGVARYLADVK